MNIYNISIQAILDRRLGHSVFNGKSEEKIINQKTYT